MEKISIDKKIWERGMRFSEFVDSMDTYRAEMIDRLERVALIPGDRALFKNIRQPIYILIMTEGWCSDGLMNLPIIFQIVDAAPRIQSRIFIRSQWPDLKTYYEERGVFKIPICTFFDGNFKEIGTWVERPQLADAYLEEWKSMHPEEDAIRNSSDLSSEEKRNLLKPFVVQRVKAMDGWYQEKLQQATVDEIKSMLAGMLSPV
jgi:hypothetical protein